MRAMRNQPQGRLRFNTRTTLIRDLEHSWAIGAGGPRMLLDATGRAHGVLNTGNFKRGGPQGLYLGVDDAGTGSVNTVAIAIGDASGSGAPKSNVFSFAFRAMLPSFRSSAHSDNSALYGGPSGGIEIRQRSDGRIEVLRQQTAVVATSPTAYPFDRDCDVGISYDDSTFRFYLDGRPFGAVTNPGIRFQQTGQYWLGAGPGTASAFERLRNGSRIHCADVWSRALLDAEFQQWSSNPHQLYAAPETEDEPSQSSPGGGTLVVTPASLMLSGGNVAMRVTRRLVVQPAALGLAAGEIRLKAARRMAIAAADLVLQPGAVQMRAARRLTVAPVHMAVTGGSIQFEYASAPDAGGSYVMPIAPAALTLAGGNVGMRVTRRLKIESVSFALVGQTIEFRDSVTGTPIDATSVPAARTVVFAGGARVINFNGGTRVVDFAGGIRTVRF